MLVYWKIFWRTFAQLELAVVLAAQAMDWSTAGNQFALNTDKLGALSLMALLGALIAALWAWGLSPATSAIQKATRSAIQALAGGLGAITINSVADIVALKTLLVPLVLAVVFAFAVTFFQNQAPAPVPAPLPPNR